VRREEHGVRENLSLQLKAKTGSACANYASGNVNDQWFAAHASDELAAEALLDQFKRAVRSELEMLDVRCEDTAGG
jgi:hypothetical protein